MSDLYTDLSVTELTDYNKVFKIMKQHGCNTCYICTSEIDAEKIMCQNAAVVVIHDDGYSLLNYLDAQSPTCMFILDIDDLELMYGMEYLLKDKGYLVDSLILPSGCAVNESTGEELTAAMNDTMQRLESAKKNYLHAVSNGSYFDKFCMDAANGNKKAAHYPTGLPTLDKLLNGGLTTGLYVLLAAPATGKTTLCLQWADHIAADGKNVLYVSAEMSREELMARSLSRQSFKQAPSLAVTEQEIFDGDFTSKVEVLKNFTNASLNLQKTQEKIYVSEHDGAPTVDGIRHQMETIEMLSGQLPVVFIDYLQLMLPIDADARRATDSIVMQLKQLSRQYDTPIVVISAVNRGSYGTDNLKSAGKESGGIEYSADCIINYDLRAKSARNNYQQKMATQGKNISGFTDRAEFKAMKNPTRKMVLTVSKNRRGALGETWAEYISKYNTVKEVPVDEVADYNE